MSKIIGIIPARYNSHRLEGKPLADICGLPMVVRVWMNVSNGLDAVYVATDDERIANVCKRYDVPFIMTPAELKSGTDRIWNAYKQLCDDADVVVNIQGDEPLLSGKDVEKMLNAFDGSSADVATLITPITELEDVLDPNCVKVVLNSQNMAMYFSRSPIPFVQRYERDKWLEHCQFWKHIGIYAYRKSALERFVNLQRSKYEDLEKLEQLRLLEAGASFLCVVTNTKLVGVDTQADLEKVIRIIQDKNSK